MVAVPWAKLTVNGSLLKKAASDATTVERMRSDRKVANPETANLAGMFTMGNHQFALTYSMYMADANGTSTAVNADCSMYGAGYFYNFSKTNAVKVVYNQVDNDPAATCMGRMTAAAASHGLPGTAAGNSGTGYQVQFSSSF